MKKIVRARWFHAFIAIFAVSSVLGCWMPQEGTIAPTLISTVPTDSATDIARNRSITATFSEAMNPLTLTTATFTLMQGATPVAGTVACAGATAVFDPALDLAMNTVYTATVTTGAMGGTCNALAVNRVWTFTTGSTTDTTAPTVSATVPANSATGVAVSDSIIATFSEAMNPLTITTATCTLTQGGTPVAGTVTCVGDTATFNPTGDLAYNTTYTATITTGVKDLADNALAVNKVWSFTTGKAPVALGTAANFVILAKTAISTIPTSAITGDIGLSPAARSYMTGFSETLAGDHAISSHVTGFMYAADMAAPTPANLTIAVSAMEAAYTAAAGRTPPNFTELAVGTIGGLTLTPGIYKWSTGVSIGTDITIAGGAGDVWIFQIAGQLTVSNGVTIRLSGGAQAKNIFWQVADIVTLGTNSHFEGIILGMTQIIMQTNATMNGRALAQTQVTLDNATITEPAP